MPEPRPLSLRLTPSHLATALLLFVVGLPVMAAEPQAGDGMTPEQLFRTHCAVCHSIELPQTQRLTRADWNWVMDDMEKYGMTWLTQEQRDKIVDYLVENYGPDAPR